MTETVFFLNFKDILIQFTLSKSVFYSVWWLFKVFYLFKYYFKCEGKIVAMS